MATKSDLNIQPLGDRVVVAPEKAEKVTASGIILADTGGKEKPEKGKVVAVGPGRYNDDGKRIPMDVKVGDKVTVGGHLYTCAWSSDDMTEEERQASADRALELLECAGIPPMSEELLAAKARRA